MDVAVSQVNRGLIRSVTIAAALVGTFEALVWICLSLVSILYYNEYILLDDDGETTISLYRRAIYEFFLDPHAEEVDDIILTQTIFNLFMYFYLVLSFIWLISSLYMLWAMTRDKWSNGVMAIGGWAGITIIISLVDVAVMGLIAADFVTIRDLFSSDPVVEATGTGTGISLTETTLLSTTTLQPLIFTEPPTLAPSTAGPNTIPAVAAPDVALTISNFTLRSIARDITTLDSMAIALAKDATYMAYTIVLSLAVRGYILWIANMIFACILIKFAYDLKKVETPSLLPMMDAYATGGRPWNNLYEQTDISNGYSNDAFKDENDRSIFPRSDSFITGDNDRKNKNPLSNGSNPYEVPEPTSPVSPNPNIVNGRVAKIGKSGGRRTPPQNIPPPSVPSNSPYIPDPDYTPPPSPRPKSVLRPKSNYVL